MAISMEGASVLQVWTVYLLSALLLSSQQCSEAQLLSETAALMEFQKAADGEGVLSGSWNVSASGDHCGWDGIVCSDKRVIHVELNGRRLNGSFAENTLSRLTELKVLVLSDNSFTGEFPSDLANVVGLVEFWAQNASFSGPFPNVFGSGGTLERLGVAGNNLTGPVPELTSLTSLITLDASCNSFVGPIPALPSSIAYINLSGNGFTGPFPNMLANDVDDSSLTALDLSSNNLTGPLPDLSGLKNLLSLDLTGNSFDGEIPRLPSNLGSLNLSYNSLSGTIPPQARKFGEDSFRGNYIPCGGSCSARKIDSSSRARPRFLSGSNSPHKLKLSTLNIVFIAGGIVVLLAALAFGLKKYLARREAQRSSNKDSEKTGDESGNPVAMTSVDKSERSKLSFMDDSQHGYDLDDLLRASAEMLGKGSFGTAYKAVLDSGMIVAVKRLRDAKDMSRKDFDHHMDLLGKLRHPNLVPLRAYYYAREEKLLIYDFMPNGSLYSLLHGSRGPNRTPLEWPARLSIAQGVALGLTHLHKEREPSKIPHGNIKSSNVLMGKNFEVCISDFGLVPLMPSHIAAQRMAGYRAPEYSYAKKISHKADVYSFGVLLLELLTGRQPAQSINDNGIDLPKWVQSVVREEWTGEVFDLELKTYLHGEEEMVTLLQIAMSCVEPLPDQRPEMAVVVDLLDDIRRGESAMGDSFHSYSSGADYSKDYSKDFSKEYSKDYSSKDYSGRNTPPTQ